MTTNSTAAEDRLVKLGIHLPDAPTPFGAIESDCPNNWLNDTH